MQFGSQSPLTTTLVHLQALQTQLDQLEQLEHPFRTWGDIMPSLTTLQPISKHFTPVRYGQDRKPFPGDMPCAEYGLGSIAAQVQAAILHSYNFSRIGTLCDIGGGDGTFLAFLLQAHESLRGVLFERPPILEQARWRLTVEGVTKRCRTIAGDFFEKIPAGADLYTIKWVLRDYGDAQVVKIFENCRYAMLPNAKLLIIETVAPLRDPDRSTSLTSRERTEGEFRSLVRKAGLRVRRIIPACEAASVIEVGRG